MWVCISPPTTGRSGNSVHGLLITHHDAGWRDLTNTKKMTRWSSSLPPVHQRCLLARIYNLGPGWRREEAYKGGKKRNTVGAHSWHPCTSPIILRHQTARTRPSSSPELSTFLVIILSSEILARYFTFSPTAAAAVVSVSSNTWRTTSRRSKQGEKWLGVQSAIWCGSGEKKRGNDKEKPFEIEIQFFSVIIVNIESVPSDWMQTASVEWSCGIRRRARMPQQQQQQKWRVPWENVSQRGHKNKR